MHGIGNTPLIPLPGLTAHGSVSLKAEFTNPYGSVKDRTALYLVQWAVEVAGPDVQVVESTSGNLGYALARICASIGARAPLLVMDGSLPKERVDHVREAGAQVELVTQPRDGMDLRESRIAVARELGAEPGCIWVNQYGNDAGVRAHEETTGPEIWEDTSGRLDAIVASVGSGGTVCGIGRFARQLAHPPAIIAVEPLGSTIFGGQERPYLPAGAGMRGPTELTARHGRVIDQYAQMPDAVAARSVLDLAARYDLPVLGLTSGAALAVGACLAESSGAHVVVVAADLLRGFEEQTRLLTADPDESAALTFAVLACHERSISPAGGH